METKFYLITLPERQHISDRNSQIIEGELGRVEIIEGYNPVEITDQDLLEYRGRFYDRYFATALRNQLACLRAHVKAMRRFLETRDEFTVIGEDDFEIKNISAIRNALESFDPRKDEAINFGGFQGLTTERLRLLDSGGYVHSKHLRLVHMMALYCVNRPFAERYVSEVEAQGINNDDWSSLHDLGLYTRLRVVPSILHGQYGSVLDPDGSRGSLTLFMNLKVALHNMRNSKLRRAEL